MDEKKMPLVNSTKVMEIVKDCFCSQEQVDEFKLMESEEFATYLMQHPEEVQNIRGFTRTMIFSTEKLNKHKKEIFDMFMNLDDRLKYSRNPTGIEVDHVRYDKNLVDWCETKTYYEHILVANPWDVAEQLVILGLGTDLIKINSIEKYKNSTGNSFIKNNHFNIYFECMPKINVYEDLIVFNDTDKPWSDCPLNKNWSV